MRPLPASIGRLPGSIMSCLRQVLVRLARMAAALPPRVSGEELFLILATEVAQRLEIERE